MSVQANIAKVEELEIIVNQHLVGGDFSYTGSHVQIIFFDTWSGLHGAQVNLEKGKINALSLLIKKLDELYNASNAWKS